MRNPFYLTKSPRKSILIVEAEELLGHLLKEYICQRSDWHVQEATSHVEEVVKCCQVQQPDVVIVSRYIKEGSSGVTLIAKLRENDYKGKIIFLSRSETPEVIREAIASGASAFISKYCAPDVVLEVIRELTTHETNAEFIIKTNCLINRKHKGEESIYSNLTEAEKEVLLLIAQGRTVKEIAFDLHKAHTTIYSHQQHIKDKFNINRTSDLLSLAMNYYLNRQEMA